MTEGNSPRPLHENLDTAYTNLAALVRYLQGREFSGRVHIVMADYEVDIVLKGKNPPAVRETDHLKNTTVESEEALRRLYVRASEPGGLISVYEAESPFANVTEMPQRIAAAPASLRHVSEATKGEDTVKRHEVLEIAGQLIAGVERSANAMNVDFEKAMAKARLELADDYTFLDPTSTDFSYSQGVVQLNTQTSPTNVVAGLTECLRRVVTTISQGPRERTNRERVALELALLARRRQTLMDKHQISKQLDRIAGTRVL